MATEIPIFTSRTRVPSAGGPPAPVLQNPQAAAGTGLALNRAAADLEKIGERVQAGVRVRALADATTALGALQTELDGTNDPAALGPLVLQRRQQIEAQVRERLGSDAEGLDLVNARLADNFSALTRAAAARGRALESDAFKATLTESGRELAARAAAGGEGVNSTAVRDYTAMLDAGVAGGRITRLEAATLAQRFRADVEGAQVLRLVRDQPGAVATVLSDPTRFTSLSAQERERYITAAATRQQAQAAQSIAAANRADLLARRNAEAAANTAEKDIIDATRRGDAQAASEALGRLRQFGTGAQYRTFEEIVAGARQDIPTTPLMRAAIEDRLRDRGNPLTREELGDGLRRGDLSLEIYRETLSRLSGREDARFREAEAFIERALEVPSGTIPDNQLQPWQREARRQANAIINDLVVAREQQPDINPLAYVRDRLRGEQSPEAALQQQRAREALRRMPEQARTPEGLATLQAQVDAWLAYQRLGFFERQRTAAPPRPPVVNGQPVTTDLLNRWRTTLEQAGVR